MNLARHWRNRNDVRFVIRAGREGTDTIQRRLAGAGAGRIATAVDRLDRTDPAYAAADAMVRRAGSATVAGLAHAGVPADTSRARAPTGHEPRMTLEEGLARTPSRLRDNLDGMASRGYVR
ncbi:hypothetical protein ACQEU3_16520 [Spirillospora sp. CA-253888]